MTEAEAMDLLIGLAKGRLISPTHPAFRSWHPDAHDITELTAERERLRFAFFLGPQT
jgi:hypothetical protein